VHHDLHPIKKLTLNCHRYVPKPKPEVSHIIRNNYDILRGEAEPNVRLDQESMCVLDEWCEQNAKQFWLSKDDPLAPRSRGGADVIIVGDLQMSSLVKIAKEQDPTRPVIFRCEIEICVYLADQKGTATSEVWSWIWDHVKSCDVFISHPVRDCVSKNVNPKKVGYMPATADWLDELNKDLPDWDLQFYIEKFRAECSETQAPRFEFPYRSYILQIVGSNHATETRDVLASYAELRHECMRNKDTKETPQLVILSYDTLTDLSATATYSQTLDLLRTQYVEIQRDVILVRSGPADQTFNALMSTARVVLQLSTRPGFEVIVSEALHKGVPVITTRVDGVSLQVEHGKSGFLVEDGDYKAVARYLHCLFTDHETYNNMAHYAATHVSDEVSTVGNALAWLYLADELSRGEKMEPKHRWINDMARKAAEFPYQKDERRLFRTTSFDATR
jgi:glycosyltransferase involved in cell wall biosynthesis